jgi:hypothetical protein
VVRPTTGECQIWQHDDQLNGTVLGVKTLLLNSEGLVLADSSYNVGIKKESIFGKFLAAQYYNPTS